MYSLRTFGTLTLTQDGSTVEPLGIQRKALAVLTVLATDGTVSRDRLMALLWPESDTERARGSLRQTIHALRQQLQTPDLILGREELILNPADIQSDVQRFRDALDRGDPLGAVTLTGAPFSMAFTSMGRRRWSSGWRPGERRCPRNTGTGWNGWPGTRRPGVITRRQLAGGAAERRKTRWMARPPCT